MNRIWLYLLKMIVSFCCFFLLLVVGCKGIKNYELDGLKIAFLADVHFHGVYYDLPDTDDTICINPVNGKNSIAFTMERQLRAIKRYNESYFAFLAAFDDLVSRGVKLVALPKDFVDDSQLMNVKGTIQILNRGFFGAQNTVTWAILTAY